MADDDVSHYETRYLVQAPDGGTATRVLRTDRPPTAGEVAAHAASQGNTFAGFAEAAAPPPAATAPPAEVAPSLGQRAQHVLLPERSFPSQLPSIGGATLGSYGGAALGAMTGPLAPVAVPVASALGAGLGSAAGEAADIGYEYVTGAPPAEPGGALARITNAGLRGAATEGLIGQPLRAGAALVGRTVMPVARAAEELAPVLRQDLPQGAALLERGIAALAPEAADQPTLLRAWWQDVAPQGRQAVIDAWTALGEAGQAQLAGGQRAAMQTVVDTLAAGQAPVPWANLATQGGLAYGGLHWLGYPGAAKVAAAVPVAVETVAPKVASRMLLSPPGAGFLAALPRAAEAAEPWASGTVRLGPQVAAPFAWPAASTLTPVPP
jgi:hypothetical protein